MAGPLSFPPTGCLLVDAIQDAVESAAYGYNNTRYWREEGSGDHLDGAAAEESYVDVIHRRCRDAAINYAALRSRIEELEGALRTIERSALSGYVRNVAVRALQGQRDTGGDDGE